jgi:hypothetical protein
VAALAENIAGSLQWCGKNLAVLLMRVPLVSDMWKG